MCIQQVRENTIVHYEILLENLFPEQTVENQRAMTEKLLSATDLANYVPETVGHIYPVTQGDVDDEHKMYIPFMIDSEHVNEVLFIILLMH